jgi:hypothetical protein
LKKHLAVGHDRVFSCLTCSRTFAMRETLVRHCQAKGHKSYCSWKVSSEEIKLNLSV